MTAATVTRASAQAVIGEAVKALPPDLLARAAPDWLRNRIRHDTAGPPGTSPAISPA